MKVTIFFTIIEATDWEDMESHFCSKLELLSRNLNFNSKETNVLDFSCAAHSHTSCNYYYYWVCSNKPYTVHGQLEIVSLN